MKIFGIFFILIFSLASCQDKVTAQTITTFILVRHAEKADDGTKNPPLSEEGIERSEKLLEVLLNTNIDAILSTPYKRTLGTVEPLAKAKKLEVLTYEPMKGEEMDKLLKKYEGKTIVLSGHSNTTPWVANYFLGEEMYPNFDDADYDNLLILAIVNKGNATVTWLSYGKH